MRRLNRTRTTVSATTSQCDAVALLHVERLVARVVGHNPLLAAHWRVVPRLVLKAASDQDPSQRRYVLAILLRSTGRPVDEEMLTRGWMLTRRIAAMVIECCDDIAAVIPDAPTTAPVATVERLVAAS